MKKVYIRTVLFDLDGTLADTAPDLAFALNTVLDEQCRRTLSYDVVRPIVSHGANALIYLGFELEPHDPGFSEIKERLLQVYRHNIVRETRLFPGMSAVIKGLEMRGLNWGVVTNKPENLTIPLMRGLGLDRKAVCIVSGDTTNRSKPDPEPMFYASMQAGSAPNECLYIGDAERDIEAGRRAGMKTLAALFGYISEFEDPKQWGAHGMINDPKEILNWLDNQRMSERKKAVS